MFRIYHLPFVSDSQRKATKAFLKDNDVQLPIPFGDMITYRGRLYYVGRINVARVGVKVVCDVDLVHEPWVYPDLVVTTIGKVDQLAAYTRWRERAMR